VSKRLTRRVLFAQSVLVLFLAAASADAQIVAGSITAINGSATVTRGTRTSAAAYGMAVDVGDRLETNPSGRLTVTLTDSSQFELTESSTLLVSEDLVNPNGTRARTTLTLLSGLIRSLVRFTGGSPNYEVHTPNAVASARGTTYDTYYTNNTTRSGFKGCREFSDVLVYDGTVTVRSLANPTSPEVQLQSGQKTTVPCGLAPLTASSMAATGAGLGTAVAASLGVAVITGGVLGGYAGAGGFGGPSPPPPPPKPTTPTS
jgi:FecR protein